MNARSYFPHRLSALFSVVLLSSAVLGVSGCTSTPVPEPTEQMLPDELASTEHVHTYGVIEDDGEAYPWTGERYEDPRFAAELDNSPLSGVDDYKPLFGADTDQKSSSVKMTKASKKKSTPAKKKSSARSRKPSAASKSAKSR